MAGSAIRRVYIIDTSSWIHIEGNPAQNRILYLLGKLIDERRVCCPPEVQAEIKDSPQSLAWLSQYESRWVRRIGEIEYLMFVGRVTERFPSMAGARTSKERADPYVVAMAGYLNATAAPTEHIVISEESAKRPSRKIGTACASFNVQHKSLLEALRDEFPDEGF